jgi:hypothetical protein
MVGEGWGGSGWEEGRGGGMTSFYALRDLMILNIWLILGLLYAAPT